MPSKHSQRPALWRSSSLGSAEEDEAAASELKTKFLAAGAKAGAEGSFASGDGPASEILPRTSRLYDLTIFEQRHPQEEPGSTAAEKKSLSAAIEHLDQLREVHQRARQPVDLEDHHHVDQTKRYVGPELQRGRKPKRT